MSKRLPGEGGIVSGPSEGQIRREKRETKKHPEIINTRFDAAQETEHNKQEDVFFSEGWRTLDVGRPFYMYPVSGIKDGTKRTVACTKTQKIGSGYDWFVFDGKKEPPKKVSGTFTVYEVKDGQWMRIE